MRHVKKTRNRRMPRILLVAALVAMICVGSVVTVMANTVEVTVKDGGSTYTFSVLGRDPEEILARAETEGMAPVSEIDTYAFDEADGLLTVERAVRVSVERTEPRRRLSCRRVRSSRTLWCRAALRSATAT